MSANWLAPLIDPAPLLEGEPKPSGDALYQRAAALLLEARLFEYHQLAERTNLPELGKAALTESAEVQIVFLSGIALHLSGDPLATEAYSRVIDSPESSPDLRIATSILLGVALADVGDVEQALAVVDNALEMAEAPIENALLRTHRALRRADIGDLEGAISDTQTALAVTREIRRPAEWRRALSGVLGTNLFDLEVAARKMPSRMVTRARTRSRILTRLSGQATEGLSKYLMLQFDAAVRDPYEQTITWHAQEPVQAPLFGALLRAECLADRVSMRQWRGLIGRYVVLSALGQPERQPESGFHLLRRANDIQALHRALRLFRRVGPLQPLRNLAEGVAASRWAPLEQQANLSVLKAAGEFLSEAAATKMLDQLLTSGDLIRQYSDDLFDAVAVLVQVAPGQAQSHIALTLFRLADDVHDPLGIVSFARAVRSVDWTRVPEALRARFLHRFASQREAENPFEPVAEALFVGIARADKQTVADLLRLKLERLPSIHTAALLAQIDAPCPPKTASRISPLVRDELEGIRRDAQNGRYSMKVIDVGLLASWLALEREAIGELWVGLLEMISDPAVASSHKVGAIDRLALHADAIPTRFAERLRRVVPNVQGFSEPLFGPAEELDGASLRLGLRLSALSSNDALQRLLLLFGGSVAGKIETARSLPFADGVVSLDSRVTLALALSQDRHHDVRAEAGRVLMLVSSDATQPLQELATTRVGELLEDAGAIVPRRVIDGLIEAVRAGIEIPRGIMNQTNQLESRHLSAAVRWAARRLNKMTEGTRPSREDF